VRDLALQRASIAFVLAGEGAKAVDILGTLNARSGRSAERVRIEAEAQLVRGDDASAFATLRGLARATEADASTSEHYWYAWARMVEILSRQNVDGSRSAVVNREIARLRATEGYGEACTECVEKIEAVARLVGPSKLLR